eukprot:7780810-Pyramimonas_sp.AAC.1
MLPPLGVDTEGADESGHAEESNPASPGGDTQPSRLQWRIREIALQRMIEATSIARVSRAVRTRAQPSGEG